MTYFVEVLKNVHGGEGDVRHIGDFDTLEEAVKESEFMIDKFLIANFRCGMTVAELFAKYQKNGDVPFIFSDGDKTINVGGFNHFKYAMLRCTEICGPAESAPPGKNTG
jgi:hypothetical protein